MFERIARPIRLYAWIAAGLIGLSGLLIACRPVPASPTATQAPPTAPPTVPTPGSPTWAPTSSKPTPTLDLAATIVTAGKPKLVSSQASPDGVWRADVFSYACMPFADGEYGYEVLKLTHVADDAVQTADSQLSTCGGMGAAGFEGKFWSPNSRYYYYTTTRTGVPDGCGYWGGTLNRLEISTLRHETMLGAVASPDRAHIASWDLQTHDVIVWDANTRETLRAHTQPGLDLGPMAWSPDSGTLVYLQNKSYCPASGPSTMIRLALPDLRATDLMHSDAFFYAIDWDSSGRMRLLDVDSKYRLYHPDTGALDPPQQ